jgi:hypothetical protein
VVVDVWDLRRSFLLDSLRGALSDAPGGRGALGRDPQLLFLKSPEGQAVEVPEKYTAMQGWEPFAAALRELDALRRQHGFELAVFTNTEDKVSAGMVNAVRKLGWTHARLLPDIQAFLAEHGGGAWDPDAPEDYLNSALSLTPDDGHPSELQHRMAADRLLEVLETSGIVSRLLRR